MKIDLNIHGFTREIFMVVRSPVFILLTIIGNSLIGLCGVMFYFLERGANPHLHHFIDAVWWSFSTATTTGTGIIPVTFMGKVLGILLMLMGMALFAMYTGLFAEIILADSRRKR